MKQNEYMRSLPLTMVVEAVAIFPQTMCLIPILLSCTIVQLVGLMVHIFYIKNHAAVLVTCK